MVIADTTAIPTLYVVAQWVFLVVVTCLKYTDS